MPPNLLSRRTLSKPEKDKHICHTLASLSPKEGWTRPVSALGSNTTHASLLTCHYFTAKCFPAKYTRALSHSATVGVGNRATVTVCPAQKGDQQGGGGSELQQRGSASPCFGGEHNSAHPGWGFTNLTKKEGLEEDKRRCFLCITPLVKQGIRIASEKCIFLVNKNKIINWEQNNQKSHFPYLSDWFGTKLIRFGEPPPPPRPSFLPHPLPQLQFLAIKSLL